LTPHGVPTARQQHALDVLASTFPLLSLSIPPSFSFAHQGFAWPQNNLPINDAERIIHAAAGINVGGQQRGIQINLRAIGTPLILLCLRTLLLLYFFSPARKPVFGLVVGAYVLYEAWGALRGAIGEEAARNANVAARGGDRNRQGLAGMPPMGNGAVNGPNAVPGRAAVANLDAGINYLAQMNLDQEARWIENGGREPSILKKLQMFLSLFLLSLHPAFWNRRRVALRAREGELRTEANARDAALVQQQQQRTDGENNDVDAEDLNVRRAREQREQLIARHARRSGWIQEYVDRVRQGDWVDD
jgi:hypothetical protein